MSECLHSNNEKSLKKKPTLFYRVSPANNGLVFADAERARYIAAIHHAMKTSKTWGEFESNMDPKEYDFIISEYFDGSDIPRPKQSDRFYYNGCDIHGYQPVWLQSEIDKWLPKEILEKYAEETDTRLDGTYYHIEADCEDDICRDLRDLGYRVIEREDLYFY